ncbi:MAG: zf-TFIIB domain-containing protein [Gemmatimonadaceae bacterium]
MPIENKPSRNEDEYFVKQDAELIKAQRAKLDAERAAAQRAEHYMKCPKCGHDLAEQDFGPIKVDACTNCHGMWLDSGEMEMISRVRPSAAGGFVRDLFKGFRDK